MFRHRGKTRTYSHNLKIASLLSFVAGMVNVAGFLAVRTLTTNVTGHFAFFVDEMFKLNFWQGLVYAGYIFFFFLGSFISNFLVEIISRKDERYIYSIPASLECIILILVGLGGTRLIHEKPELIAFSLLFAMGLQNSLVTSISNARVRTTHLTGLFTDLGIELSQLFFYRSAEEHHKLFSSIKLRLTIIGSFFTGGILGGVFYPDLGLKVLLIAAGCLVFGLIYDRIRIRILMLRRRLRGDGGEN